LRPQTDDIPAAGIPAPGCAANGNIQIITA